MSKTLRLRALAYGKEPVSPVFATHEELTTYLQANEEQLFPLSYIIIEQSNSLNRSPHYYRFQFYKNQAKLRPPKRRPRSDPFSVFADLP